jgi:HAD superfamily hydrolase (TIGR01549 family)
MKEIRILFTGVGRRVELISAFRQAALCLNVNLKIYRADMTGTAPTLAYCDYTRKVCSMKDATYISELLEICKKDQIDLLIPTIDTDLLVLSENVSVFAPTKVLISDLDKIIICRDKNNTADFFKSCGCYAPKTFNDWKVYDGIYPCFIKPKDGSSSINAFKVDTVDELEMYAQHIQPFIEGAEYTVDIFCDFEGNPVYITPRIRLQVRAGEVLKTQISMDKKIIEESRRIVENFKPVGPMTVQLIRQRNTEDDYFIEINPRYGGGAPLSMKAGARSAEAVLKLLINEAVETRATICDGAIYSRFDNSVCIQEGITPQTVRGIIFDLDDTLYNEKQYIKSGFKAVAEYLGRNDAMERLWNCFETNRPAIDTYLNEIGLVERKADCLKIYRDHKPEIELNDGVAELIADLRNKGIKVGIITDGRPSGQRNKIAALGLEQMVDDIIITDELGGEQFRKPCDIAFRIMQRKWRIPFEQMVYIGDNLDKDFQAPKQLGMQWKWFQNIDGIYLRNPSDKYLNEHKVTELRKNNSRKKAKGECSDENTSSYKNQSWSCLGV